MIAPGLPGRLAAGAALIAAGISIGLALDSGRVNQIVQAVPAATVAEHGEFTSLAVRDISDIGIRFAGSDVGFDPDVKGLTGEHGAFTSLAVRDISDIGIRHAGSDVGFDPDVKRHTGEHGAFTSLAVRDLSDLPIRFAGGDIGAN